MCGMVVYHHLKNAMDEEQQVETIELMYRQPGVSTHQKLTDVMDELILTVRELSERMLILEEFCDQVAELENENFGGTD